MLLINVKCLQCPLDKGNTVPLKQQEFQCCTGKDKEKWLEGCDLTTMGGTMPLTMTTNSNDQLDSLQNVQLACNNFQRKT